MNTNDTVASIKLWHILTIAIVAILFTSVWLGVYNWLMALIWNNSFVTTHHWTLPVLVLFFSLLVGLAQKYLGAPNVIRGGAIDALQGKTTDSTSPSFIGSLITSFASLLSGAVLGPEGSIGCLILQVSAFVRRKLKISSENAIGIDAAALASAYNGVVGSPLFTGILASEIRIGGNAFSKYLVWNLLAGVVGFCAFTMLGLHSFAQMVPFTPISTLQTSYFVWAIILGLLGTLVAIFTGLLFKQVQSRLDGLFGAKLLPRVMTVALLLSLVGWFAPQVLFAGETQIFPMLQNPAAYGVAVLFIFGLLKLFLLAVSMKGGYLGGPTFPVLFASTMFGLVLSLLFPAIPVSIFVMCLEVAVITVLLNAPLTAILLVAIVGTADTNTVALLVISTVVAMLASEAVKKRMLNK